MENASKALIILGAILLALMIIGVSMFVFNLFKNPVARTVDSMSSEERNFFNSKFKRYESGRVSGLETKALVNISMQNASHQFNLNEKYRIPEISISYRDKTSIFLDRAEINSITDLDSFKVKFQNMLNKISNAAFYSIKMELNAKNGIVSNITIEEINI